MPTANDSSDVPVVRTGPLAGISDTERLFSQRREHQLIWALLIIGLAARLLRYLLRFPLWDDESLFLANLVGADYGDLLGGLNYRQVAPLGFLWLELTLRKLLGFNEFVLRLPSLVCSVAGLFLFRHMAGRVARGPALVFAIGMYAVSYPMIRYAAEAKPYGIDLFASLILLSLAVEWWYRGTRDDRWLWLAALLVGPMMLFSYPAVFVAGAISAWLFLVLAGKAWAVYSARLRDDADRRRSRSESLVRLLAVWIVFNISLGAGFLTVYRVSIVPQSERTLSEMQNDWDESFPPLGDLAAMPGWLLRTHTGPMLAYPLGGPHYGSTLTFLVGFLGIAVLIRSKRWMLLLLLLGPFAVTGVAAAAHRYPYGGMGVRINIYVGPAVCLLAGWGFAALARGWRRDPGKTAPRIAWAIVVFLAAIALASMARDISLPAKTRVDQRFRDFSRWFWFEMEEEAEVVCMKRDLGLDFAPGTYVFGFSSMYLCNQEIYSPRRIAGREPDWSRVSRDRPLRCVQFTESRYELDDAALEQWLDVMSEDYLLIDRREYPVTFYDKRNKVVRAVATIETFDFIPRNPGRAVPPIAKHSLEAGPR